MTDSMLDTVPLLGPVSDEDAASSPATASLVDMISGFAGFGQRSVELVDEGIPYVVNEFWTAGQRQAHPIHEVSYRACFKPQLPEFFIDRLTCRGDAVYDPFMGRGTTPIQAALMGRRPVGNDVNPLSTLLTRPRLRPPSMEAVALRLRDVPWEKGQARETDLLAFYSPRTLRHLDALRTWLLQRAPLDQTPDPVDDWIRMVAINRLTGHSPGFFSAYTMPPNQAVSTQAQRKINALRLQTPPDRDLPALILKKSRSLLRGGPVGPHPDALLTTASAPATPLIASGSIDLVVTSPPFLDIVAYADDNWLRSWFAGIDPAQVPIASHRSAAAWQDMVRQTLVELSRLVRPGGHVAFEVGEVRGGKILLERLVWEAAATLPFQRLLVMVNQQRFTKTANCWGVHNNAKGTNSNRIVVLKRDA